MANIFKRRKRPPATAAEQTEASDRSARESRQAIENEAHRRASDGRARDQAVKNEARRRESDDRARDQAVENELSRQAADDRARDQAVENDAVHRVRRGGSPE